MVDLRKLINDIRNFARARLGLTEEDNFTQGFIHTSDDRERTVLSGRGIHQINYMLLLHAVGGDEWGIMGKCADNIMHLQISLEGARATAFINAISRKREEQEAQVTNVNVTQPQDQAQQKPKEKKGWLHR